MTAIRIPVLVLALYSLGYAKDWKVFCIPEKHLDVGWSFLPADALDQGYPGSVEEFQNFSFAQAMFIHDRTTHDSREVFPPEARFRWFVDSAGDRATAKIQSAADSEAPPAHQ